MQVQITIIAAAMRDGSLRLRHDITDPETKPQDRTSIFGIPKDIERDSPDVWLQILEELPRWVRQRFLMEALSAVQHSTPEKDKQSPTPPKEDEPVEEEAPTGDPETAESQKN